MEKEPEYRDSILEKMHRQLDRIYKERDFSKLAALQSLLNLADPGADPGEETDRGGERKPEANKNI
jgi:hypothetical protein